MILQFAFCILQFALNHASPPSAASINVRIGGEPDWPVAVPKNGRLFGFRKMDDLMRQRRAIV
jgi:hypothetical protein